MPNKYGIKDPGKGAKKMKSKGLGKNRAESIGKLGRSIANFFSSKDKKKADKVKLDKSKTSDFKRGFNE